MKVAAVIPVKNENELDVNRLRVFLDQHVDAVIVASDTPDIPGLGPAYLAAWKLVPQDWSVLHVDVGHDEWSILEVLEPGIADVVIGSRFCPGGQHHGPKHRQFVSRAAAWACNLTSFYDIADWTSGLRLYSPTARRAITAHTFRASGHAWQIEALAVALADGSSVIELPICYEPSQSALDARRAWEAAKLIWGLAWSP